MAARSSSSASATAMTLRQVRVVEVGQELGNHQEHQHQSTQAAEGLGDGRDDVVATVDRAGSGAVADARHQEEGGDDEQQAVHERRIADDAARVGVAQRSAGRQRGKQHHHQHAQEAVQRELQAARFGGLPSSSSSSRPPRPGLRARSPAGGVGRVQPRLDHALGDQRRHDAQEDQRDRIEEVSC